MEITGDSSNGRSPKPWVSILSHGLDLGYPPFKESFIYEDSATKHRDFGEKPEVATFTWSTWSQFCSKVACSLSKVHWKNN